jgi:hypothetical protein
MENNEFHYFFTFLTSVNNLQAKNALLIAIFWPITSAHKSGISGFLSSWICAKSLMVNET